MFWNNKDFFYRNSLSIMNRKDNFKDSIFPNYHTGTKNKRKSICELDFLTYSLSFRISWKSFSSYNIFFYNNNNQDNREDQHQLLQYHHIYRIIFKKNSSHKRRMAYLSKFLCDSGNLSYHSITVNSGSLPLPSWNSYFSFFAVGDGGP
jgi:hypothetical protein